MEKCKLCKKNDADKTGSHIVPHFLLKRIINIEGETDRGYELAFSINEFTTQSYFGRSIQPEKLDEIYGTLTDKEIEENKKDPYVVDNLFCTLCENRLGIIETKYAQTISTTGNGDFESGVSSEIGLLFWLSVVWRLSIDGKYGNHLTKYETEISRKILDRSLSESFEKIDLGKMRESTDIKRITYKLLRCPNYSDKNPTTLFFHPHLNKPYSFIIDEYIVLLSFKNNFIHYKTRDLFGLKKEIIIAPINKIETKEIIHFIPDDLLKSVIDGLIDQMKIIRANHLDIFLDKVHALSTAPGKIMPSFIKGEIFAELTDKEKKLGRKFTLDDLRESTAKIMKKYSNKIDTE